MPEPKLRLTLTLPPPPPRAKLFLHRIEYVKGQFASGYMVNPYLNDKMGGWLIAHVKMHNEKVQRKVVIFSTTGHQLAQSKGLVPK